MRSFLAFADDVDGPIAACEPFDDERKEHFIGFLLAAEERADMPDRAQLRVSKMDVRRCPHRPSSIRPMPVRSRRPCITACASAAQGAS
jgi:hypothetical protein